MSDPSLARAVYSLFTRRSAEGNECKYWDEVSTDVSTSQRLCGANGTVLMICFPPGPGVGCCSGSGCGGDGGKG